jgi:hypothetical protein
MMVGNDAMRHHQGNGGKKQKCYVSCSDQATRLTVSKDNKFAGQVKSG